MRWSVPMDFKAIVSMSVAMIATLFQKRPSGHYAALDSRRTKGVQFRRETEAFIAANAGNPNAMWARKTPSSPAAKASQKDTRPCRREPHHSLDYRWNEKQDKKHSW